MKILGAKCLWHLDAGFDTARRAFNEQWYGRRFVRNRNRDGNLYVRYLNWNGDRWNWNANWLDNDWNDNNPAAVPETLFISRPASAGLCLMIRSTRQLL
jgi:hypothetical protein